MQQAIARPVIAGRPSVNGPSPSSSAASSSYSTTTTTSSGGGGGGGGGGTTSAGLRRLVAENPVLVVGRRGCCMCHVVKHLLFGLGVNPAIWEVRDDADEIALIDEVAGGDNRQQAMLFPAVFIGGRLVGGLDSLMAVHISGELVPILKEAGALWL